MSRKPARDDPGARRERLLRRVRKLPRTSGVYIMKDAAGAELYVGKAKDLRARVRTYFDAKRLDAKARALVAAVAEIEILETPSEVEALLLESRLIKDLQPKFNVELKGTSYPLVEVTRGEPFPRVRVTRDTGNRASRYHGPFVEAAELRAALAALRRVFRYCTCPSPVDPRPRRPVRPCLDHHVGLCLAPCAGRVDQGEYRAMLRRFEAFLDGRGRGRMLAAIKRRMSAASRALRYEEAARLRDELAAVESLARRGDLASPRPPEPPRVDPREGLADLCRRLDLPGPPRRIEGLDLASLSGREAAGSVVTFLDGRPAPGFYRRYRIKLAPGDDDYAQMAEVVGRRARRLAAEDRGGPDLLLVDGGAGHLRAALRALERAPAAGRPRTVCSLAKREEIVHLPGGRALRLPRTSPALKILQHVRDEAHRFAGNYHRRLREGPATPARRTAQRRKKK
jgi:excinuclease ABC subunit C